MSYSIPTDLIENFRDNRSSFLIGAGMSISAGFPSWNGLIKSMIERYSSLPYSEPDKLNDYNRLLKEQDKLLLLAEDLKETLGKKIYIDFLEEVFGNANVIPTENHECLIKLNPAYIITLNYDRLIENAFNRLNGYFPKIYSYNQSREAANAYWKNQFFVFKAHGDANTDSESLILTQKDYRNVLFRENGYRSLIQTMFTSKSMLMIGLSLNDPEFKLLLENLHDSYHTGGPTHYILLDEKSVCNTTMKRYMDDFNIQTISFSNPDGKFQEITLFLNELIEKVRL